MLPSIYCIEFELRNLHSLSLCAVFRPYIYSSRVVIATNLVLVQLSLLLIIVVKYLLYFAGIKICIDG